MKQFIEKFNTQDKCDKYRRNLENNEWSIYWKDAGGIIIRESENNDGIGNKKIYVTIQLCDMIGSDGYDDEHHIYKFVVFLYCNGNESFDMFKTIEEAIDNYKNICMAVSNSISNKTQLD